MGIFDEILKDNSPTETGQEELEEKEGPEEGQPSETEEEEKEEQKIWSQPPARRETATEVVTKSSNASIRFDVKIMLFEALGIKRLAYLMDCNNQQFIDQPRLMRLFGQEGPGAWRMIEPGQLVGEWDYRPSGSNVDPAANKEVRRQQLNQMMAFVLQTNNPYVDKYELTKMWLEAYDIRNVEKLLIPKDQLLAQIQAVQEMQAQGAGPGIPTTPQVAGMGPENPTTPATVAPGIPP